jgi:hypothetical protein
MFSIDDGARLKSMMHHAAVFELLGHEVLEEAVDEERLARATRADDEMQAPPGARLPVTVAPYLRRERVFAVPVGLDGTKIGVALDLPQHRVEHEVGLAQFGRVDIGLVEDKLDLLGVLGPEEHLVYRRQIGRERVWLYAVEEELRG